MIFLASEDVKVYLQESGLLLYRTFVAQHAITAVFPAHSFLNTARCFRLLQMPSPDREQSFALRLGGFGEVQQGRGDALLPPTRFKGDFDLIAAPQIPFNPCQQALITDGNRHGDILSRAIRPRRDFVKSNGWRLARFSTGECSACGCDLRFQHQSRPLAQSTLPRLTAWTPPSELTLGALWRRTS